MTVRLSRMVLLEFDAFSVAVASSAICGALSVIEPWLVAPAATLAAIALAAWMSLAQRRGSLSRKGIGFASIVGLIFLGTAAIVFLWSPPMVDSARGLILAAGLLPLFATERTRRGAQTPRFANR